MCTYNSYYKLANVGFQNRYSRTNIVGAKISAYYSFEEVFAASYKKKIEKNKTNKQQHTHTSTGRWRESFAPRLVVDFPSVWSNIIFTMLDHVELLHIHYISIVVHYLQLIFTGPLNVLWFHITFYLLVLRIYHFRGKSRGIICHPRKRIP